MRIEEKDSMALEKPANTGAGGIAAPDEEGGCRQAVGVEFVEIPAGFASADGSSWSDSGFEFDGRYEPDGAANDHTEGVR